MSRRLPRSEHLGRPWRIHEIAPDFHVQDVWAFSAPGAGPADFPAVLAAFDSGDGPSDASPLVRFLFAARWKLGAILGWDKPDSGLGTRVRSLRERLPEDLRRTPVEPNPSSAPFTVVYELDDEAAFELANRTVHGIAHFGWVATADGYEMRMTVLVKPNGLLGRLYLAVIEPFRLLIVYPAMMRRWDRLFRRVRLGA
ncbi:DUF2867 domain-containing protein [Nocardia sp. NPDC005825]|uniref:DUF2867 domain-containing protein n=1 Tax=unclassified Nocardia TaxID=2637762 RepID=UPI0033CA7F70